MRRRIPAPHTRSRKEQHKNTAKQKYNIVTVKTVNEKDYYTRIGVAFPLEKGGFNILFDALPTNGRVLLLPDRPRSDKSVTED